MPSSSAFRVPAGDDHGAYGAAIQWFCRPALTLTLDGELDTVITFHLEDGLVTGLSVLRDPEKLGRLGEATPLRR